MPPPTMELAYEPASEEEKIIIGVFDAPEQTKDQIFTGAKIWIAQTFRSAKAVIEYEDAKDGVIIGNGSIQYPCTSSPMVCSSMAGWKMPFTVRIDLKDNKFRMTFTNIRISWPSFGYQPSGERPAWGKLDYASARPHLLALGPEMAETLKSNATAKKDW